ncbi:PPE family protein, partial [Mycobacterium riyadhense]
MFSGLGPEPLLAAAGGWSDLAGELNSAAVSFESVTSGLVTDAWQGAAASAMTAAAAPYRAWLSAASTHADTAANLARAAAAAFEAAQAATVLPAAISANRNRLVSLVMSNLFGFNAPAIAAAEAEYELMWAQDIAAMLGYHGEASAIVGALTPIVQPLANIANAPAQAVGALVSAVAPQPSGPQPAVAVSLPELTIPPIQISNFELPSFNLLNLNFAGFTLPGINIPQVSVTGFSLPPLSLNISASSLTIPSFTFPGFTSPGITLGGFSTPQLATAPLVLPSVAIPAGGFWIPSGGANIPANMGQL